MVFGLTCRWISDCVHRIDSYYVRRWLQIGQTTRSGWCGWSKWRESHIVRLTTEREMKLNENRKNCHYDANIGRIFMDQTEFDGKRFHKSNCKSVFCYFVNCASNETWQNRNDGNFMNRLNCENHLNLFSVKSSFVSFTRDDARTRLISLNHAHQIWLSVPWQNRRRYAFCGDWSFHFFIDGMEKHQTVATHAEKNQSHRYLTILTMISRMGCVVASIRFSLIKQLLVPFTCTFYFQGKISKSSTRLI